ncbi:MAG: hypothetical protein Q9227_003573 [Pyrenula ochraceoflavens]
MAGDLILISGVSGHIGYRTLVEALSAGYQVRAQVRGESSLQKVKTAPSIQPYLSHLSFITVPDIEAEGAWDEAVKGAKYIIHVASPIASPKYQDNEWEEKLISPAVRGTLSLLNSALRVAGPQLSRIVITASTLSIIPWTDVLAESGTTYTENSRTQRPSGPFGSTFEAYSASKVASFLETEYFLRREKPQWDVNFIAPSFTIGANELVTDASEILAGTNGTAFGIVLGEKSVVPTPSMSVHVNDIAKMHVRALDPSVAGGQVFIGVSNLSRTRWEDAERIVRRNFPEAVVKGLLPLGGERPTKNLNIDNSLTRKTLGMDFMDFEEQVKSVTEHYLKLKGEEAK